jgi:hypothetical protein
MMPTFPFPVTVHPNLMLAISIQYTLGGQCGFFRTPLGLGLATAMTSAAFVPHCEQRIRGARSVSVTFQPTMRANVSGSISRHASRRSLAPGTDRNSHPVS